MPRNPSVQLTVQRVTVSGEYHCLARAVKLELDALVLFPFFWNVQRDLEPVIRPTWSKGISLFGRFVGLSFGFCKSRLASSRGGPYFEANVLAVVDSLGKEQCRQVMSLKVSSL